MTHNVRNTTALLQSNPAELLVTGLPGGIEHQERQGQRELLRGTTLPVDTKGHDAEFIALGFAFGEPVAGDEIFREATLPEGWKREGSDHAMWTYIVDDRGFQRVGVFYKAAFYDRSAHMHLFRVGSREASGALYGEGEVTRASVRLDAMTPDEIADFRAELERTRANVNDPNPSIAAIYAKNAARLALCDALFAD